MFFHQTLSWIKNLSAYIYTKHSLNTNDILLEPPPRNKYEYKIQYIIIQSYSICIHFCAGALSADMRPIYTRLITTSHYAIVTNNTWWYNNIKLSVNKNHPYNILSQLINIILGSTYSVTDKLQISLWTHSTLSGQ